MSQRFNEPERTASETRISSFSGSLATIRMHADDGPVGRGGSGARYIRAEDGSKWVMKATFLGGHGHAYFYVNEALGAQIGWRLGASVPHAAIVELTEEQLREFSSTAPQSARYVFASQLIEPAEALTPESAKESSPVERATIVALDELIWNSDRQAEHVLAEPLGEGQWRLHPIDHANCFAVADVLQGHLEPDRPANAPLPLLTEGLVMGHAEEAIGLAEAISRREFYEMVRGLPAAWLVEPDAADQLADALHARAARLAHALANHLPSN